jgi:DNA segregation ATPase FtsK/SpoIIIE-like protein
MMGLIERHAALLEKEASRAAQAEIMARVQREREEREAAERERRAEAERLEKEQRETRQRQDEEAWARQEQCRLEDLALFAESSPPPGAPILPLPPGAVIASEPAPPHVSPPSHRFRPRPGQSRYGGTPVPV